MSDKSGTNDRPNDDRPFHQFCANCDRTFDETVLQPVVTIAEGKDDRAPKAFCDEYCLKAWAGDG